MKTVKSVCESIFMRSFWVVWSSRFILIDQTKEKNDLQEMLIKLIILYVNNISLITSEIFTRRKVSRYISCLIE